jgi:hypothetical protein
MPDTNTKVDHELLTKGVVHLFHSLFSEILDILSSRFPHRSGDKSQNEAEYNAIRAKILRSGNNKLRELPEILSDYKVTKERDTEVEVLTVGKSIEK